MNAVYLDPQRILIQTKSFCKGIHRKFTATVYTSIGVDFFSCDGAYIDDVSCFMEIMAGKTTLITLINPLILLSIIASKSFKLALLTGLRPWSFPELLIKISIDEKASGRELIFSKTIFLSPTSKTKR